jgi:CBS domain containing-hemolysin-like protein
MEELHEEEFELRFSRIPVFQDGIDEISGFIHKHDLLLKYAHDEGETQLKTFKRPIMVMPMVAKISTLLERMLAKKEHMVLLVDEYGGTAGIATLEDIVETLLGMEILDEFDEVEDMRSLARQQWKKRVEAMGITEEQV